VFFFKIFFAYIYKTRESKFLAGFKYYKHDCVKDFFLFIYIFKCTCVYVKKNMHVNFLIDPQNEIADVLVNKRETCMCRFD
jgi:hypothetical protein